MLTASDLKKISLVIDDRLDHKLKSIKLDLTKLKQDNKLVASYFDNHYLEHDKRLNRLENKIGINSSQLA